MSGFLLQLAFYEVFDVIPFVALAVVPFRSKIRSTKMVVLFTAALYILGFIRRILSSAIPSLSCILSLMWAGLYLLLYRYAVREFLSRLLFVLITVLNYASMVAILYNYVGFCIFGERLQQNPYSVELSISILLVLIVTYPIMLHWFAYKVTPLLEEQENAAIWNKLWLVPLTFCIIFYYNLYTSGNIFDFSSDTENLFFSLVVSSGSFFVLSLVLKLVETNALTIRLQSENYQLEMNMLQFQKLSEQIEKTRQARHDQRQLINVLQVYLNSGDTEYLYSYVKNICSAVPDFSILVYCRHPALNALICYYADLSVQNQIDFSAEIDFPDRSGIDDVDLIVLFGNMLENAFEACKRQESGNRFMNLKVRIVGGQVVILLDNSYDGMIKRDENSFLSLKHSGNGIGTASIRRITSKYQGTVNFDNDDAKFHVSVRLNIS